MQRITLCLTLICLVNLASASSDTPAPEVLLVAQNSGTEITDLLVPFAVLSHAGIRTEIIASESGPVNLMNDMQLVGLRTLDDIPDLPVTLVVIPAVHHNDDTKLVNWLIKAHYDGAMLVSICDGALLLAETGLLDNKNATAHFYSSKQRQKKFPGVNWVSNRRYIHDGQVMTTAGVSASAPASVYLVEQLRGREAAQASAEHFGISTVSPDRHETDQFAIGPKELWTGLRNYVLGLRPVKYNLHTTNGIDEYALAFTADALGRTYRSSIALDAPSTGIMTAHGLNIVGQRPHSKPDWIVTFRDDESVARENREINIAASSDTVDTIYRHILNAMGRDTASFVATQLEIPSQDLPTL